MVEEEDKIDEIAEELTPLISEALEMMIKMREVEGEKLKEDILLKISKIEKLVSDLNVLADNVPKNYKVKLEERLKELSGSVEIDESRIATEICLLLINLQ